MQGAQGHSRKESDDFKLSFGDDTSANFEVDGVNILMDPALELSLSFQQPKASFTFHSFCALFAIRIEVSQLKLVLKVSLRCGIAEKRRTLICISLNNKRITKQYICYMPRSFKL